MIRVAKVREKKIFFKVREKSGSFVLVQAISKSLFKFSEKSGNFFLRWPQIIFYWIFLYRQGNFVFEIILIFVDSWPE